MKAVLRLLMILFVALGLSNCGGKNSNQETEERIFNEVKGILAVEAEEFYQQDLDEVRKWYVTDLNNIPKVGRDEDSSHAATASGNAYLEILPDTRVTDEDELIRGENFSNEPGKMAILHYKVQFNEPGRYYAWVRAHSVGGEDNGIHIGIDGEWPESGQRMQWCEGKGDWRWESKQRTEEVHCGEPWKIYLDVLEPGKHDILFSMREDGFEFDKFLLVKDTTYLPTGMGPELHVIGELGK